MLPLRHRIRLSHLPCRIQRRLPQICGGSATRRHASRSVCRVSPGSTSCPCMQRGGCRASARPSRGWRYRLSRGVRWVARRATPDPWIRQRLLQEPMPHSRRSWLHGRSSWSCGYSESRFRRRCRASARRCALHRCRTMWGLRRRPSLLRDHIS